MSLEAKRRILLVDDERRFTESLQAFLERTGLFEVRITDHGSKALNMARQFRPHLVLLDVVMPDIDGGDVAAAIRDDEHLQDTPVVFLTAAVSRAEVGPRGTTTGGYPCLAKPVSAEEVLACVERYARKSEAS